VDLQAARKITLPGIQSTAVNLFVLDNRPLVRAGVRAALETSDRVRIVGEASSGEEALRTLGSLVPSPDVVLIDLELTEPSGVAVTRAIVADGSRGSTPRVLVFSSCSSDDDVVSALRAGARGYIAKNVSPDELLRAIVTVADGGAVFSPMVAERLSMYFSAVHELPMRLAFPQLTEREREILDLLARGHDNRRIARALVLSEKTVRNHVSRVFSKLQVTKRTEAAMRARDAGLGT
jgi:DNA-binding NarL/FixJ family response regulator